MHYWSPSIRKCAGLCIGEYAEYCIFMETEITQVRKMLAVNRMKLIDNVLVNNNSK